MNDPYAAIVNNGIMAGGTDISAIFETGYKERYADLLAKYDDQIAVSKEILGKNGKFRNSTWLRQKVADLYLEAGLEKWGEEYEIALGGGFISVRSPYDLEAGNVTYGMLQSIFPFDNELVLCSVKGVDLLNRFIHTSNEN